MALENLILPAFSQAESCINLTVTNVVILTTKVDAKSITHLFLVPFFANFSSF